MTKPLRFALLLCVLVRADWGWAEEIPRDVYLKHLPLGAPRLVQQTSASDALYLYGDRDDPTYRDENPVDGIDDARYETLMELAIRFAPFLVQNTSDIPVNFETYIQNRETFGLHWDRWDVTEHDVTLVESRGLNVAALGGADCRGLGDPWESDPRPSMDGALEDCKLLDLLDRMAPGGEPPRGDSRIAKRPHYVDVLFYDFPGQGESTWNEGYEAEFDRSSEAVRKRFPHAYVHPFVFESARGGYELVLQYWFFYPSNDSGMDHEGDWEHMNVVVAPKSLVDRPLSPDDVRGFLQSPPAEDAADPLVIRRVDYYFHHLVMTLDFSSPNVYKPREEWEADLDARTQTRFMETHLWRAIRRMAYVDHDETWINTHPFGYIGADNKGLNQAMAMPGNRNRNPHGTYPLPGRYQNVGPGGSTDQVSVFIDPRQHLRLLNEGRVSMGPVFRRGSVLGLADRDRLTLVPDWERVIGFTRRDPEARRRWAWLVLPLHWGYPATTSPFSGVLEHYNTGNVSPVGPSFNDGWNVSGASPGFSEYEPHTIPSVFPLQMQDSFRNDLGFLNLTVPTLLNLPPLDFAARVAFYPFKLAFGRRDPVYYPKEGIPFRFMGFSSGVSVQVFGEDYNAMTLAPNQFDQFVDRLTLHFLQSGFDSTTTVTSAREIKSNSVQPFFQLSFYIGGHFTSENTVRNARSTVGFSIDFNNIPSYDYRAELNYWEYAGSLRYSLSTSRFQPFVKAGYGWSWYRVENVRASGVPFDPAQSEWVKPPNIWPNVWHYGLGLEFVPFRRIGTIPGGLEIALRVEYGRYHETLGLDLSQIPISDLGRAFSTLGDVPIGTKVTRNDFLLGMTASF